MSLLEVGERDRSADAELPVAVSALVEADKGEIFSHE